MPENLRIQDLLVKHELSQFLVTNLVNVFYLTGLQSTNACALLLEDEIHLYTDPRYEVEASVLEDVTVHIGRDLIGMVCQTISERDLLFVDESLSYAQSLKIKDAMPHVRILTKPKLIEELRVLKSPQELEFIRLACDITSQTWQHLVSEKLIGRSEKDVARRIQSLILTLGGDGLAFDSIVAAGAHSASPHHTPSDYVIQAGDFIKCDFGAKFAGYHSDMTRMAIAGKPAAWQREIYDVVLRAQEAGVAAVQVNSSSQGIDRAARDVITSAGFGDAFTHPTGHGIGLEIHEIPIHGSQDITLCPSMTLTVEPGIYLQGQGGVRLEDTLVVLQQGTQNLTTASKALVEVE